jgi:hypothetical protein
MTEVHGHHVAVRVLELQAGLQGLSCVGKLAQLSVHVPLIQTNNPQPQSNWAWCNRVLPHEGNIRGKSPCTRPHQIAEHVRIIRLCLLQLLQQRQRLSPLSTTNECCFSHEYVSMHVTGQGGLSRRLDQGKGGVQQQRAATAVPVVDSQICVARHSQPAMTTTSLSVDPVPQETSTLHSIFFSSFLMAGDDGAAAVTAATSTHVNTHARISQCTAL